MRIIVVGAGGGTGRLVAEQGVHRGHDVVALSRSGAAIPGATSLAGDATRPDVVAEALGSGADALVLAIGGVTGTDTNRTDVTRAVLDALSTGSVGRLVVHSSLGVGDSMRFLPAPMRAFTSVVLRKALADHDRQEELVRGAGLPWTIVRPGGLTNKPATGRTVALEEPGKFTAMIPRADVAAFILDCLEKPETVGHAYALGVSA